MNNHGSVNKLLKAIFLLSVPAICAVLGLFSHWTPAVKFSRRVVQRQAATNEMGWRGFCWWVCSSFLAKENISSPSMLLFRRNTNISCYFMDGVCTWTKMIGGLYQRYLDYNKKKLMPIYFKYIKVRNKLYIQTPWNSSITIFTLPFLPSQSAVLILEQINRLFINILFIAWEKKHFLSWN